MSGNASTVVCLENTTRIWYALQPALANPAQFTLTAVTLVIINGLLGIYTILANAFVIDFYRKKIGDIVPLLYTSIGTVDLVTGITALMHSLIFIFILASSCSSALDYLVVPTGLFTMWMVRVSVFFNLVLSISRTINIVQPFAFINKKLVVTLLVMVPLLWLPLIVWQMTTKYSANNYMEFKLRIITSSSLVGEVLVHKIFGPSHNPPIIFCLFFPFILPSILCLISLAVQMRALLRKNTVGSTGDAKVRAAQTIFLLTLVFVVCNTASSTFWAAVCLSLDSSFVSAESAIWVYVTSSTIPFLNSALAPTIMIVRGKLIFKRFAVSSKTNAQSTLDLVTVEKTDAC